MLTAADVCICDVRIAVAAMPLSVTQFKAIAAALLFITAIAGGLLPFLLKQRALNTAKQQATDAWKEKKRRKSTLQADDALTAPSPVTHAGAVPSYSPPAPVSGLAPPESVIPHYHDALLCMKPHSPASTRSNSLIAGVAGFPASYGAVSHVPMGAAVPAAAPSLRTESFRARHPEVAAAIARRRASAVAASDDSIAVAPTASRHSRSASSAHSHGGGRIRSDGGGCCSCLSMDVDRFLSLGNCLGAGIFLGGGLLHLLPEAAEGLARAQSTWGGPDSDPDAVSWTKQYPISFLLCGLGFFTILLVEEITIAVTNRSKEKKDQLALQKKEQEQQQQSMQSGRRQSRLAGGQAFNLAPQLDTMDTSVPLMRSTSMLGQERLVAGHGGMSADPQRDLARNIVQGLTPRTMLLPTRSSKRSRGSSARRRASKMTVAESCCSTMMVIS